MANTTPTAFPKLRGDGDERLSRGQDNINITLGPLMQAVAATPIMGSPPPPWIRPDLVGGYSQTVAPQPLVAYHKDALGYTHVRLALTHVVGTAAGTAAFTFDMNNRPTETLTFVLSDAAGAAVAMTVAANGQFSNVAVLAAGATVRGVFSFLAGY